MHDSKVNVSRKIRPGKQMINFPGFDFDQGSLSHVTNAVAISAFEIHQNTFIFSSENYLTKSFIVTKTFSSILTWDR